MLTSMLTSSWALVRYRWPFKPICTWVSFLCQFCFRKIYFGLVNFRTRKIWRKKLIREGKWEFIWEFRFQVIFKGIYGGDWMFFQRLFHGAATLEEKKCFLIPVASCICTFFEWPLVVVDSDSMNIFLSGQIEQWQDWSSLCRLFLILYVSRRSALFLL